MIKNTVSNNKTISDKRVTYLTYLGIFLIALSTLMFEILLTRIFSVTMGYHFAFMAISLAMFGMSAGAIFVYLKPHKFTLQKVKSQLSRYSFLFSLSILVSFFIHLFTPFIHDFSLSGLLVIFFTYALISIPFVFSGICICLLLTKYPAKINRLYAADLTGAAIGCILVIELLDLSGGINSVIFTSFFAMLSAYIFSKEADNKKFSQFILISILFIFSFGIMHTLLVRNNNPLLRLFWIRGEYAETPLYEKWNSFTRISIDGDSTVLKSPFGWGISNKFDRNKKVRELMLNIDAMSTTVLSGFDGDLTQMQHLRFDISNIVHYLRKDSDVLIIGSGGGRDILSSLLFEQKSMLGVEINKDMISITNETFGDFTGHLDKYPNVKFVGDEARSYIQRLDKKFDIIQISVIDNWSATSSGAFVLMENAIYTKETWKVLFDRLKPNGILSVTRFYRTPPIEIYRLLALCTETLMNAGIKNPREHIIIMKCNPVERIKDASATGNILMSKSPLSIKDLEIADSVAKEMDFSIILNSSVSADSNFINIASVENKQAEFVENFPLNIKPPTDDKPFFFHMLYFGDVFDFQFWKDWDMLFNVKAIFILLSLLLIMILLLLAFIFIPLKISPFKISLRTSFPYLLFFAAIGLGFILIEISQIQRLNIYLGHPTLSLAVSLFTILLMSGIGSYLSGKYFILEKRKIFFLMFGLTITLFLFGLITNGVIQHFKTSSDEIRILMAILILTPIGLFMGTAFPLGLKLASNQVDNLTPWLWGINGVTSVLATVLAIIFSMNFGISKTYWCGVVCYLLAVSVVLFLMVIKKVPLKKAL